MTAFGAIDAAVEAARKAVSGKLRRGDEFTADDVIVVSVKAAARVLLAAERDRIAKELEKAAEGGLIFTGMGHEIELLKAGSSARAQAFRDAAAIARAVAGQPDTQGGQ